MRTCVLTNHFQVQHFPVLRLIVWSRLKLVQWIQEKLKIPYESDFVYKYMIGAIAADDRIKYKVFHEADGRIQWMEIYFNRNNKCEFYLSLILAANGKI